LADKKLTPTARKFGILQNGYYWYEEDIAWTIPCFEVPEWTTLLTQSTGADLVTQETLKADVERWFPQYFESASPS